ncbi:uncharacterized protein BO96DRAFT_348397 [Aspergillus niger CBS 101883]|uniref:Rhodopsin domain-containing protein n=1 Tax=Aspergillus niger ATCC 13496 TaxID=1353008 RepID=A0A370BPZ5_ASPNG|nr:uncharacterized protein BO96DRAFT_348397 [Aspergillus niger CBS 101883]PYH52031.1 hypothetical protein BO96DRAFT_348397 [Aspergillus niger CBS 101883]RDH17547.1 hypothetical protein M747DRAFT_316956 [Aspergillus niger ATCC 13496]
MSATSTAALTGTGTGVIPAPEGVTPDLKDPERHYHTANLVVVIVGVTVSTLCLLVRVYTRVVIVRKWLLDDGDSILTQSPKSTDGYTHAGLGVHEWDLTRAVYNQTLRVLLLGSLMYIPALGLSKISLIILYYRLSDMQRKWRITLWGMTAFVVAYMIILECLFLFTCDPVYKAWHPGAEGHCWSRAPIFMAGVVASMFIDLVLLVMPLPIVVRLQMASRKRIGLVCMFGLGGLNVEASLVIITACVPSFRQVLRFHSFGSWNDSGGRIDRMSSTCNLRSVQRRQEGFTNISNDLEMDQSGSAGHDSVGTRI